MKIVRYAVLSLLSLPGTYWLTSRYMGTGWSERIWTWLNQLFGDFGLASDIELFLSLACAFSLSFATLSFLFWAFQMLYNKQSQNGTTRIKEVFYASLAGFWVLFATYFLLWLGDLSGVMPVQRKASFASWAYLGASLIVVLAVTLLGFFLWRRISNALTSRSSGRAKARR